jgi:hypothetical protein
MEIKGKICIGVDPEIIIDLRQPPDLFQKRPDLKWNVSHLPPQIILNNGQTIDIGEPTKPELFKTNK